MNEVVWKDFEGQFPPPLCTDLVPLPEPTLQVDPSLNALSSAPNNHSYT